MNRPETPTLYQFHYSPYCEKVRWALDKKAVPYRQETLLPGLHAARMLVLTGQHYVPVLRVGGERVVDSTQILAVVERLWPERPLYPAREAERRRALDIEDFCDEDLGKPLKRVAYSYLLQTPAYLSALFSVGQGPAGRRVYRAGFGLVAAAMRASMGLSATRVSRAADQLERALDRLASEIQPSGYLVGDRFSSADLTAASMISPLLPRPWAPYLLQSDDLLPAAFRAWRDRFSGRPAVQWAAEIYEHHRALSCAENPLRKGSAVI